MQQLAIRTLVLTTIGLALGLSHHWLRFGTPFAAYEVVERCEAGESAGDPLELDPVHAAEVCARPDVLVLDVRPPDQYAAGHVADAVHLPCSAGELRVETVDRLDRARTILIYGQGTADARQVAQSLMRLDYTDVRVIAGGYPAWEAAGQACSSGPCPGCLGDSL